MEHLNKISSNNLWRESILYVFIALFIALVLVNMFIPLLNQISGKDLNWELLNKTQFIVAIFIITILTGIFSGSYPAFFLSSFHSGLI